MKGVGVKRLAWAELHEKVGMGRSHMRRLAWGGVT